MRAPVEALQGIVAFSSHVERQADGTYTNSVVGRPHIKVEGCRDEEDAIRQLQRKMQQVVGTGAL